MVDGEFLRTVAGEVIRRMGHTAIKPRNAEEGLKLFSDAQTGLVITDIVMPETEGLGVMIALRKNYGRRKSSAMSGGGHRAPGGVELIGFALVTRCGASDEPAASVR